MSERTNTRRIKQVRGAILAALKMLYPAAIQAETLLRSLLAVYPQLEWEHLRKDLSYLVEKGYIRRTAWEGQDDAALVPWRKRYFRLTATGVEVADRCVEDRALY